MSFWHFNVCRLYCAYCSSAFILAAMAMCFVFWSINGHNLWEWYSVLHNRRLKISSKGKSKMAASYLDCKIFVWMIDWVIIKIWDKKKVLCALSIQHKENVLIPDKVFSRTPLKLEGLGKLDLDTIFTNIWWVTWGLNLG